MNHHLQRICLPLIACLTLSACETAHVAGLQFLASRFALSTAANAEPALNPDFSYLRVASEGGVAWLALGGTTGPAPFAAQIWFSGDRQVMRTRHGRLVQTAGLPVDWVESRGGPAPEWRSVPENGTAQYQRHRDVMPGYRHAVTERVTVRRVPGPPPGWRSEIQGMAPSGWAWFREDAETLSPHGDDSDTLPPAWFAVDLSQPAAPVMASRQCLSARFCLDIQARPRQPR